MQSDSSAARRLTRSSKALRKGKSTAWGLMALAAPVNDAEEEEEEVEEEKGGTGGWRAPLGGYCMGYMDMNVGMKLVRMGLGGMKVVGRVCGGRWVEIDLLGGHLAESLGERDAGAYPCIPVRVAAKTTMNKNIGG